MDYHDKRLADCVREKIEKDETVSPSKLENVCKIDFRTVSNHFSNIVGKDLGDGTKILSREKTVIEYYRDPPEDQEANGKNDERAKESKPLSKGFPWELVGVGVIALLAGAYAAWRQNQDPNGS